MMIQTSRLLLRPFLQDDLDFLIRLFQDRQVMEFSNGLRSPEESEIWLENQIKSQNGINGYSHLAIQLRSNSELIGYCGIAELPIPDHQTEMEIGYRLSPEFWDNGFATEAAIAVRDYAFNELSLARLVALVDPGNDRSIKVAQKLGMKFEKEIMMPGYSHPDHMYAIRKNGIDESPE